MKRVLKGDLMFFRTILFLSLLFLSGCATNFQALRQTALIEKPTNECNDELKNKIAKLSGIKSVKVSNVFINEPYLVLTNRPKVLYPHDNKPEAVPGSEKFFMLYLDDGECFVGLLNEMEYITKRERINKCSCKVSEKK